MKKFLLVCLLGLGMLLPSTTITAKESVKQRIINVNIEGWVLFGTSQTEDGPISVMEVRKMPDGKLMASKPGDGYSCTLDISDLPSGTYVVTVVAAYRTYTKQFRK